jgi:hypothetical protein
MMAMTTRSSMRVKPVREGRFMITSGSSRSLRDDETKSGAAAPQSKTLRDARGPSELRQVAPGTP